MEKTKGLDKGQKKLSKKNQEKKCDKSNLDFKRTAFYKIAN